MSFIHMKTLQQAMSMIKLPNDLPLKIQRHRRQHQRRLNARNRIECLRRPTLREPNGQEFGRPKAEEKILSMTENTAVSTLMSRCASSR